MFVVWRELCLFQMGTINNICHHLIEEVVHKFMKWENETYNHSIFLQSIINELHR
jgi:hypothetical protein